MAVASAAGLCYTQDRVVGLSLTTERVASVTDSDGFLPHCIRVLIVDEHAAVRHALCTFLAAFDDLVLAGEVANGEEAIRLCACTHPDIVLLDVTLPDMTGAAATRAILERCPATRVIGTCTFQEADSIPEALSAGAVSCLLKNVSAEELASTIRAASVARSPDGHPSQEQGKEGTIGNGALAPRMGVQSPGVNCADAGKRQDRRDP